ncbi:MAG: polysaccharide pyruvyl transferase family protein [Armatimonadota bacterium]
MSHSSSFIDDSVTGDLDASGSKGRVLLVVCLYENNFGDQLIYQTIEKKLHRQGFTTETVEISEKLSSSRLIERANNSDFLYFVGGGLIERWAPDVIRYFTSVYLQLRVPHGVIGLSTGSFDYSEFNNSLKLFCDTASFFYTRDEDSVEAFVRAGASKLPEVGVDVVFANDTLGRLRRTGSGISANFRNIPYPDITGDLDWAEWGVAMRNAGVKSLIPDCSNAQEQLGLPVSQNSILAELTGCSMVVAMRFHIVLAAAMMGVLPVPVAYCPKVKRLADQLGIGDYCLGIKDSGRLAEIIDKLKANEQIIRINLAKRAAEMKLAANKLIDRSIKSMECVING